MRQTVRIWTTRSALVVVGALALATSASPSVGARDGTTRVTKGIIYRQATTWDGEVVDLTLDRYLPPEGTAVKGAVVWIHGGGFVEGAQDDPADVAISTRFAQHGYVTASIGYRLGPAGGSSEELENPDVVGRIVRAYEDARAALEFVRAHASAWGIDPDRIFAAGASAGGGTALNLAYLPGNHTDPTASDRVAGAVSIIARTEPSLIEAGEAPMLMINGTEDTTVPLSSAEATCDAAHAVGVACELVTFEMGHGDPALFEPITDEVTRWLDARVAELDAETEPPGTLVAPVPTSTTSTSTPAASAAQPVAGVAAFTG